MEGTSQREPSESKSADEQLRRELRKAANRILIDAHYTGRQHMLAGQWWGYVTMALGVPASIVAALSSAGAAVSALFGGDPRVTAGLAIVSAVIAGLKATVQPEEKSSGHTAKGGDYVTLRNDAWDYMEIDLRSSASLDALVDRQRRLRERLEGLRAREPRGVPPGAYKRVKKQTDQGWYEYENDPFWKSAD
jgi:hypothetical protein